MRLEARHETYIQRAIQRCRPADEGLVEAAWRSTTELLIKCPCESLPVVAGDVKHPRLIVATLESAAQQQFTGDQFSNISPGTRFAGHVSKASL